MKELAYSKEMVAAAYDHLSPETYLNPYPAFERLRLMGPRAPHPHFGWVITDYELASAVLKDTRFSANRLPTFLRTLKPDERPQADRLMRWFEQWALFQNAPVHTANRAILNKAFTPAIVDMLRPRIQAIVDELCEEMEKKESFDFIKDFAYPLPVIVIAELLGLPREDRAKLKVWSDELTVFLASAVRNLDIVKRTTKAIEELNQYLSKFLEDRRQNPRQDLITMLVSASDNGNKFSDEQICSTIGLLIFAGHETTTNLLGNGLLAILQRPYAFSQLSSHPELTPSAVEEFMRFDSAVQMLARVAHEPIMVDGQFFEPGLVSVLIGGANRDPLRFHMPDRLILDREDNKHLGFGIGHHFCLGAKLARVEAEIAFKTLLARFPKMRLVNEPLVYQPTIAIRALKRLNVVRG